MKVIKEKGGGDDDLPFSAYATLEFTFCQYRRTANKLIRLVH